MTTRRCLRAAWCFGLGLTLLPGCGLDNLLLTPRGYQPSDPPRPVITGTAPPGADVRAMSASGEVVARAQATASGEFTLRLPPLVQATNLRLLAQKGAYTAKALVPLVPVHETTSAGTLDDHSTALAQVAAFAVIQQAGSSFQGTPPTALRALLASLNGPPTPELTAFAALVGQLLTAARQAGGDLGPFDIARFDLSADFVKAAGLGDDMAQRYAAALGAAAQGYSLQIACDPSRLNVMFTVDVSGRALDGNGVPQLMRQPLKAGHVFLGFTLDESSPITDPSIPNKLTPNDTRYVMSDDGKNGDEIAGDQIYTVVVPLARGARVLYKYTDGAAGDGFTGSEEWPGNARILEVEDVLTGRPDGQPDCLVIRRDAFGDEASNKNFVDLNAKARANGGTVSFDTDLGGMAAPLGKGSVRIGGLDAQALRKQPPLTPAGVPEARENGVCTVCPAPLVLDPDDTSPPALLRATRVSLDRVRVTFSKPLNAQDAVALDHYLYLDEAGHEVPVFAAAPQGADVILTLAATDPRAHAELRVHRMRDATVHGNMLERAAVEVGADDTAPTVVAAVARSILEIDPTSAVPDPTVGDIVDVTFDEVPEASAASDASRFQIDGLAVLAAAPMNLLAADPASSASPASSAHVVRLVTEPQRKGAPYVLHVRGVRDAAGNALDQDVSFEGFALYRVRFGAVVGFAFADRAGKTRGLPPGERLYLTGTPLGAARDLSGRDISVSAFGATRTDVTGWPQFEMKPGPDSYEGQPIYQIDLLLPKGNWSWKPAHGAEGDHLHPPVTLEKVYKNLATANDATGVRIDPVTMLAANGVSYAGARLSASGQEPPRRTVIFKRETPDELCDVSADVRCPFVVAGTWRDLLLDAQGRTQDYDDGIVALPPLRPALPDAAPPKLLDARARDSFSILLSFDKALGPTTALSASLVRADNQFGMPVTVIQSSDLRPHQIVLRLSGAAGDCAEALQPGVAYTVGYAGAADAAGHLDLDLHTQTLLAPETCVPFGPLVDRAPPRVTGVQATDLTEITVRFDKRVDPSTATVAAAYAVMSRGGTPLAISAAAMLPDQQSVALTTAPQQILTPYRLSVRGIADANDPPNVLTSTAVEFVGFGDRTPPNVLRVRAIGPGQVLVRFDKALDPLTAGDASRYAIPGLMVTQATFAGDPTRRVLAFNPALAPKIRDAVLLATSMMTAGQSYTLNVDGVHDLSGNPAKASAAFTGVAQPPAVDVVLEYQISDGMKVAGMLPSRAISLAELQASREGVFVLGARARVDNTPAPGNGPPVNDALGGFGMDGAQIDGLARPLLDNGVAPDLVPGDGVFTVRVPAVPLGTTIIWKAFASYSAAYHVANPSDPDAAFADALPGPSVFSDGQEYPGNENGMVVLDDAGKGSVRVRCLFGDEVTFKKASGGPAFVWITGDFSFR